MAADCRGGFILYRPRRFGWLALGLVLLIAACGPASSDLQVELTEATPSETGVSLNNEGATDSIPTEGVQLATPPTRVKTAPTETETAPAETPPVSGETAPNQVELTPTKAPRLKVDVKPEDVEPAIARANPGPSEEQIRLLAGLDNLGAAPELPVNEIWLNSEPLQLADLRGKVVMVEFWTFG
jgi:hypothetical protein